MVPTDVGEQLELMHTAAQAATPPRLLELARVRIATLLGDEIDADDAAAVASWPTDPRFDDTERAALAFTEHFVIDVASLDDHTAAALRDRLGDEGLANFVSALLVVEQRIRLRLAWARLLGAR